jgi:hypothetical protein
VHVGSAPTHRRGHDARRDVLAGPLFTTPGLVFAGVGVAGVPVTTDPARDVRARRGDVICERVIHALLPGSLILST